MANAVLIFLAGGSGSVLRYLVGLALTVGLCGGFTTFSTFSREALDLVTAGRWCAFSLYIAGSVILGIAAAVLGFACARS